MRLEIRTQTGPDSRDHRKMLSHHFVVNAETGVTVGSFSQLWNAWDCVVWKPFLDAGTLPIVAPSGLFQDNKGPGGKIGYTSDPTGDVRTMTLDAADREQVNQARLAVRKFIHAHTSRSDTEVFTMSDADYFDHDPGQYETDLIALTTPDEDAQAEAWALKQEQAAEAEPEPEPEELPHDTQPPSTPLPEEAPEETPEPPSEPVTGEDEATTPPDPREALREALSDSERNAFDNYTDLANDAPNESARALWQGMADDILNGAGE